MTWEQAGEPSSSNAAAPSTSAAQQAAPSSSAPPARDEGVASSSKPDTQAADRRLQEAQAAVGNLPIEYLTEVAHILGRPKLNDTASAKTAAVTRLLVECAPQHRGSLLSALQSQLNM